MLRSMLLGTRLRTWTLVACAAVAMAPSRISRAEDASPAAVAAARKHFERARAYTGQGAYREAIAELEAAHQLDPNAKDLVFNLGVVHEKLSDIDEALNWFRLYTTMELVPQERERADAYIRRLEGAKKELEEKQAAAAQAAQQQAAPKTPTAPPEPTPRPLTSPSPAPSTSVSNPSSPPPGAAPDSTPDGRTAAILSAAPPRPPAPAAGFGRVDALTVGAATLAAAGLAFGVTLAVKAEVDQPTHYVTGRDGTLQHRQDLIDQAHHEALAADVGFAAALVSGIATAYLYFGRPRVASATSTGSATVSAAPLEAGGALFLKGSF